MGTNRRLNNGYSAPQIIHLLLIFSYSKKDYVRNGVFSFSTTTPRQRLTSRGLKKAHVSPSYRNIRTHTKTHVPKGHKNNDRSLDFQ